MHIFKQYIEKQNTNPLINFTKHQINASLFVVIPCYNEPDIISTVDSLSNCDPPNSKAAVIIVVNSSEDSPQSALLQNLSTLSATEQWKRNNPDSFLNILTLHVSNLPKKFAGVGWARKIGMDEVITQLIRNGQEDAIIISLDADCSLSPNYLRVIERKFEENNEYNFFTINFIHPVSKTMPSCFGQEGIIRYELHMRYYRNAMKWCGYTHSIYTLGSSFAVRASAYVRQGGMNRRKAGEDFYFLHKLVMLGPYGNISSTTVYPSARISDRVPFGTGATMKKWAEGNSELMTTYSFDAFLSLKPFFENPGQFLGLNENKLWDAFKDYPAALQSYIKQSGTDKAISELQANCSNTFTFVKRFFHRFNAFWILKYLNFVSVRYFNRSDLCTESCRLLLSMGIEITKDALPIEILEAFRNYDRTIN